jgi:hypothetical protein
MSARRKPAPPAAAIGFAALAVFTGAAVIGIASGAIPYDAEKLRAPRWLVALAGSMFVAVAPVPLASIAPRLAPLARAAGVYVGVVLLVLVHWVAFGDGERQFFSGPAHGGSLRTPVGEHAGRAWFGAIAVLLDALVLWALWRRAAK